MWGIHNIYKIILSVGNLEIARALWFYRHDNQRGLWFMNEHLESWKCDVDKTWNEIQRSKSELNLIIFIFVGLKFHQDCWDWLKEIFKSLDKIFVTQHFIVLKSHARAGDGDTSLTRHILQIFFWRPGSSKNLDCT